jgi:Mg2+ and Co2+ transporter CorA
MKIIKQIKAFLDMKKKKQRKDIDTLKDIIEALEAEAEEIERECESVEEKKKCEKLEKEHKAIMKLLKKSRKRYEKLTEE